MKLHVQVMHPDLRPVLRRRTTPLAACTPPPHTPAPLPACCRTPLQLLCNATPHAAPHAPASLLSPLAPHRRAPQVRLGPLAAAHPASTVGRPWQGRNAAPPHAISAAVPYSPWSSTLRPLHDQADPPTGSPSRR